MLRQFQFFFFIGNREILSFVPVKEKLKFLLAVQWQEAEFFQKGKRAVFYHIEHICQIRVIIIIHLKGFRFFGKQYPRRAAKGFYVSVVIHWKSFQYNISHKFLSPNPGEEAVHHSFITSFYEPLSSIFDLLSFHSFIS